MDENNTENNEKQEQEPIVEQGKVEENQDQEPIVEQGKVEENQNQEPIVEQEKIEEEVIKESKTKKGSYITGTIGAILGGLVASIPWILTYSFANMIVAALALVIAGGAYFGYKIFKGKIGKGFPVIITIVSLLVVTIVTTVICPTILIAKSGYNIAFYNLVSLYTSENRVNVRNAIIEDLIISLAFTAIGIAAIVRSISIQIKNGATSASLRFSTLEVEHGNESNELDGEEKAKKRRTRRKIILITLLIVIIGVAVGAYMVVSNQNNGTTKYTVTGTNIELNINSNQELYGTKEEISEKIGKNTAEYYDFIIEEKEEKYEISGQVIGKTEYEENDINEIIQKDRNEFAAYFGEDETSNVEDKSLGGKIFKFYYYNYISTTEKECRTQVYLMEEGENYLWIEARSLNDIDMTEIDQVIENLF